jgi:hypothetical protein
VWNGPLSVGLYTQFVQDVYTYRGEKGQVIGNITPFEKIRVADDTLALAA